MRTRSFIVSLSMWLAVLALAGCGGSSHHGQQRTTDPHAAATSAGHQSSSPTTTGRNSSSATTTGRNSSSATTTGASAATSGSSGSAKLARSKLAHYYGDLATYGSAAGGTKSAAILSAFEAYLHATIAGDWSVACARLSTTAQRSIDRLLRLTHHPQMGCAAGLNALAHLAPPAARRAQRPTAVFAVRVNRPRAFVLYRAQVIRHAFIGMVNQGGTWRATALVGSGL